MGFCVPQDLEVVESLVEVKRVLFTTPVGGPVMVVRAQVPQVFVVVVIDMEETRIDASGLDEVSGQRLAPVADSHSVRIVECRVLTAS